MLSFTKSDEQAALSESARRFTRERIVPIAAAHDEQSRLPIEVIREAWELGFAGPTIPAKYGGAGASFLDDVLITEELAYGCTGIQTSITCNSLAATPLILAGSEDQKRKYLGMLTSDFALASYCTTEPGAGSDVAGMQTRAEQVGTDWVIRGSKCFITNASFAQFYVVFATVDPTQGHRGVAAFIVDRDAPGLSVGKSENKLGQRASDTNTVMFEDVAVPKENLLAGPGHGFKLAMQTFDIARPNIGASCCGLMRRAIDESVRYAKERSAFGGPIARHQAVQFMLADMAIKLEATQLLTYKAASLLDAGARASLVSAYAKAFGADSAMQTAVDAVQIFGGHGCMKEHPVEKLMRDAKILQIYEGTSQIQRVVIAKHLLG